MWTMILFAACSNSEPTTNPTSPTTTAVAPDTEPTPVDDENTDSGEANEAFESRLATIRIDEWEDGLLADIIEETRLGVRLHGEQGFGLCAPDDRNRCEEDNGARYIGRDLGVLPHGTFIVKADLQAPAFGEWPGTCLVDGESTETSCSTARDCRIEDETIETSCEGAARWKVEYERECTLVSASNGSAAPTRNPSWIRELRYKPDRAYPQRFPAVQSPSREGSQECVIRLYSLRPDGSARTLIAEGQFTIPGIDDEAPEYNEFLAAFAREEAEATDGNADGVSETNDGTQP